MSNSTNSFNPRQAAGDLFGFVRGLATQAGSKAFSAKPSQSRIRAAVLTAISVESLNARQISASIETASAGVWSPSDGEIQVELAALVDAGFATLKNKGDRKTYLISKSGEAELQRLIELNSQEFESKANGSAAWPTGLNLLNCESNFLSSATKLGPVLLDLAQTASKEQQAAAAKVLEKARHDLHVILAEK